MSASERDAQRPKTKCSCEMPGTIPPMYAADATASAAIEAAVGDAEQHPSVEKCGQIAISFAQINVLAAGVGKHRPEFGEGKQANSEITPPSTQTPRKRMGWGSGPAMSFAVRKMDEPMIPPTSSRTESSNERPRTKVG